MRYLFLAFIIAGIIYFPWLQFSKTLSSADWPYLYPENIKELHIFESGSFWLDPYYKLTAKIGVGFLSLPWEITERIFWFFPFLILCLFFSWKFTYFVLKKAGITENVSLYSFFGVLIFSLNTYILMILGGGQMGICISYSLAPLFLYFLFKNDFRNNKKDFFLTSFTGAVELMFDPRIFILTVVFYLIYELLSLIFIKIDFKKIKYLFLTFSVIIILNLFWIVGNIGFFKNIYSIVKSEPNADFLSFATFENTLSLLHPNWPDNIFGKIGFMKPEFILSAILAYSSLFFISKLKTQNSKQFNNRVILFFAILGLAGAFLAKGTNSPFGEIYLWLSGIPGFLIFRDPTKFYLWIILSYSVLIPFAIFNINKWTNSILKFKIPNLFLILVIGYWLFLINPAIFGQLGGTFKPQAVPDEYVRFKDFLKSKPEYFTVLWVPQIQRFGFYSNNHPAVNSRDFFHANSLEATINELKRKDAKKTLIKTKVKYVVIPYDSKKEIFIDDRKYQPKLYYKTLLALEKINYLKEIRIKDSSNIKVFLLE